jgi:hypothetical protein
MTQPSAYEQRQSFPAEGALPGEDDGKVAPDEAMAAPEVASGDPQQVDPGGYPHAPSRDVPEIRTDVRGGAPGDELPQPQTAPGPGEHNAQVKPADDEERRAEGSA